MRLLRSVIRSRKQRELEVDENQFGEYLTHVPAGWPTQVRSYTNNKNVMYSYEVHPRQK